MCPCPSRTVRDCWRARVKEVGDVVVLWWTLAADEQERVASRSSGPGS
jgi:hypothetical protein